MNQVIAYAKLPFKINIDKAKSEVGLQLAKEQPHFNTAHYTGEWTVINLRSSGGKQDSLVPELREDEIYMDTELMEQCSAIKMFIQTLACPVMSVRLLNLKSGASIKEHRDVELSFEKGEARLHIPLFTNEKVAFFVEGKQIIMHEGECWYINANLPHKVSNFGATDRIHLVIDCSVNDWLKDVFISAEKYSSEEVVKTDQLSLMIRELRLQNTTTSNQLADTLEQQLNTGNNKVEDAIFPHWLPYKFQYNSPHLLLQWLYVNDQPFTDPFFDETISKCKTLPENSKAYKPVSECSVLSEWASMVESVEPTAFVFHVSRCGSTLLSQLLGLNDENISLSEVPLFDEILQLPLKGFDESLASQIFPQILKFYGGKRTGLEKRMFIKTDSWHLLFHRRIRALNPRTPFIIIYRNPAEVIFSQQRQKGMHAVPGLVAASLFGFDETRLADFNHNEYMALVLEKYFKTIIEIIKEDKNVLLVNYNEGMTNIMQKTANFVQMELEDSYRELFLERSRFHAKNNTEIFKEKYSSVPIVTPNLKYLENLYNQIEQLRLQAHFMKDKVD